MGTAPCLLATGPLQSGPRSGLLVRPKARFDRSDHDVADVLVAYPSTVSQCRPNSLPDHQFQVPRKLEKMSANGPPARRLGMGASLALQTGLSLTGPDELLKLLAKSVIQFVLSEEMTDHLGYEKHDPAGVGSETSVKHP